MSASHSNECNEEKVAHMIHVMTNKSIQKLHRSSFLLLSFSPSFISYTFLCAANLTGSGIVVSLHTLCSMLFNVACVSIVVAVAIAIASKTISLALVTHSRIDIAGHCCLET